MSIFLTRGVRHCAGLLCRYWCRGRSCAGKLRRGFGRDGTCGRARSGPRVSSRARIAQTCEMRLFCNLVSRPNLLPRPFEVGCSLQIDKRPESFAGGAVAFCARTTYLMSHSFQCANGLFNQRIHQPQAGAEVGDGDNGMHGDISKRPKRINATRFTAPIGIHRHFWPALYAPDIFTLWPGLTLIDRRRILGEKLVNSCFHLVSFVG